ncbi:MAG: DUF4347 domain-containing protein, partial [Desulfuromonadaceae bacterium]|nr:DUF4347 domain-containing protein [Desulfuromonadaceae bacterium]
MLKRLQNKLAKYRLRGSKLESRRKIRFETLEPRILLSADMGLEQLDLLPEAAVPPAIEQALAPDPSETAPIAAGDGVDPALSQKMEIPAIEMVIIDPSLTDPRSLVEQLQTDTQSSADYEIHILDSSRDGFEQVREFLDGRSDISAIHIFSHGSENQIKLGDSVLSLAELDQKRDQVALWGEALTGNRDILLYGCNVAAGESGFEFVRSLADATGADVAASDDATGMGGDWVLEHSSGQVETSSIAVDDYAFRLGDVVSTEANQTLLGTSDSDTFIFRESVDGNGDPQSWGADVLDQTQSGGDDAVDFSGVSADLTYTFTALDQFRVVDDHGNSLDAPEITNIIGGSGTDTLDFSRISNDLVFVIRADGSVSISDGGYSVESGGTVTLSGGSVLLTATSVNNLIGGSGNDTFVFERGAVLPGTINGGNGETGNRLDYSAWEEDVSVDLSHVDSTTGMAPATATVGVRNIQHVTGGAGDDTLTGDGFQNILLGGAGNDTLSGGDEADFLDGGSGNDILFGGSGDDVLIGGSGSDTLSGGAGDDRLTGGSGTNSIAGGDGTDILVVETDADMTLTNGSITIDGVSSTLSEIETAVLTGGDSANTLDASAFTAGPVILDGGGGNDILIGTGDDDTLIGGEGEDRLTGGGGTDTLIGGGGIDTVVENRDADFTLFDSLDTGGTDDAVLASGDETELLTGIERAELIAGAGDNRFDVGGFTLGALTLDGGSGSDTLDFSYSADNITCAFTSLAALTASTGTGNTISASGITQVKGGSGRDLLDFSALAGNLVFVIRADGSVAVSDGSYTINADGTVTLSGGTAMLTATDVNGLVGGTGTTTFVFEDGAVFEGTLDGGPGGTNLLDYSACTDLNVYVDMMTPDAQDTTGSASNTDGISRIHNVTTGSGDDEIYGSDAANVFITGAGNDIVMGAGGDDTINAGEGDDILSGGAGADILIGGAGSDVLQEEQNAASMVLADNGTTTDITNDAVLTTDGVVDSLLGIEGAVLIGGGGDNIIDASGFTLGSVSLVGGAGNDTLTGGSGDDYLSGGLGNDILSGGGGIDTLIEARDADFVLTDTQLAIGAEVDILSDIERAELTGGNSNNTIDASAFTLGGVVLDGGAGDDILYGGHGDDLLTGGEGIDRLFGGPGT